MLAHPYGILDRMQTVQAHFPFKMVLLNETSVSKQNGLGFLKRIFSFEKNAREIIYFLRKYFHIHIFLNLAIFFRLRQTKYPPQCGIIAPVGVEKQVIIIQLPGRKKLK